MRSRPRRYSAARIASKTADTGDGIEGSRSNKALNLGSGRDLIIQKGLHPRRLFPLQWGVCVVKPMSRDRPATSSEAREPFPAMSDQFNRMWARRAER